MVPMIGTQAPSTGGSGYNTFVRIGLSTPVVIQMPGVASPWERDAGIDDIARIAEAADNLGFDYLTCSEHVAVPADDAQGRGSTYWDPLATLAFLAARTSRIRLATSVVVLGYHHPLAIAKRYGTLDRISGGRLVLGVGVGSLAGEFELLGAHWGDRGSRADDAMSALRAALSSTRPAYNGEYFRFDSVIVDPCAVQPRVPIWVGGRTRRSLRRAVELGDGWMPFGLRAADITSFLASVDLPPNFDVVLATPSLDPLDGAVEARRQLDTLRELGATAITCSVAATSAAHLCDQLAALSDIGKETP
jgi:probable F420-dependent oxidoreductase